MKSFNDFEIAILHQISSFRKEGIISLKDFLEKIFFNPEEGKALIIQLREQYAIFFITNKIYNNPISQREAIIEFSQLLALLDFLNTQGVISIFRNQHLVKEPMYFLSSIFHEPKIENNKIILNVNGLYTDKPEELKNAKGDVIYKGIQFNDSHFVIKNLMGNIVISDKINTIIDEINPVQKKTPFYKHKIFRWVALLLLVLGLSYGIHSSNTKNTEQLHKSIQQLHKKIKVVKSQKNRASKTLVPKKNIKHFGIDISKWNGTILKNNLPDSIDFVICKATEGKNFLDPMFSYNWKEIQQKKLKRGAYHFYVILDNPITQANFFWEQIKDLSSTDFSPIVDIEHGSFEGINSTSSNNKSLQQNLLTFLTRIQQLSGRTPMVYTNHKFANAHLTSARFSKYPLWIADYENKTSPNVPDAWINKGWTAWQKSPSYHVDSKTIDLDVYIER